MQNLLSRIFSCKFLFKQNLITGIAFTFCITLISQLLALALRFDLSAEMLLTNDILYTPFILLIIITFLVHFLFRLDVRAPSYLSFYEVIEYIKAHAIITIAWAFSIYFLRVPNFSRAVIVLQFLICLGLRIAPSILHRIYLENSRRDLKDKFEKNALIVGAGEAGHLLVRLLKQHNQLGIKPTVVLDDNLRLKGTKVHGVSVVGAVSDLEEIIKQHQYINLVLLAIPNISQEKLDLVRQKCRSLSISCKKIQAFDELVIQDFSVNSLLVDEDLILERESKFHPSHKDLAFYTNKSILVTGGGGSIGSEIVRQLLLRNPINITVVDTSEYNLFKLEQELKEYSSKLSFVLADIRNQERMERIFSRQKPQIVFHAAAYKHVPLAESNSSEVFDTNVFGTKNLLSISAKFHIENFVLISSDKAVAPVGIMGATKRLAENLVLNFILKGTSDSTMKKAVVRFGNVINSTGSVLPIFKEQILGGGPITVTHPDMERYFMSIQEAVNLVLTAASICEDQGIFVLDMGKKIKISEIAQKMIQMLGKKNIDIVYTGVRPGERLSEDVTESYEKLIQTEHPKIRLISKDNTISEDALKEILEIKNVIKDWSEKDISRHIIKLTNNLYVSSRSISNEEENIANN